MQGPGLRVVASFFLAGIFSMSLSAPDTSEKTAVPGTVNYVEGQASIGSEALNSKSIGSTQLETNQTLTTQNGKAEILLTPGVFLRVGSDSTVKMISPGLANTDVGLEKGHAMVEVAEIHPQNDIRISANDATTTLRKTGLYDFDLRQTELRVFDGEASVLEGDQHTDVKGGHKISLNNVGGKLKSQKFDKKQYETDDLYRWSSLRSAYLAEANVNAARIYVEDGWGPWGPGWWGADWYWNPWFDTFTFIPGDGIFYSPFGWGFYSPWWVSQAPFYGYAGGRPPDYRHFSTDPHNWGPGPHYAEGSNYTGGIYHGPGAPAGGGFHSGPGITSGGGGLGGEGFHGGGFHGGGFHGGVGFSGGGGFHGR